MTRYIKASFCAVILMALICSCSNNNEIKLGFLINSKANNRFVKESQYFAEYAKKNGAEVIINEANNNSDKQYELALEMFKENINVLTLVGVNANVSGAIVREAKKQNIKVILYNRFVKNCEPDFFIAGDIKKMGHDFVEQAIKYAPTGNYVILGGDKTDRNGLLLNAYIDTMLQPYIASKKIKIVYETCIEEWSAENALHEMKQVLSFSNEPIDAVITCNDRMANSVLPLLRERGWAGKIFVSGQDANPQGVRNILSGEQFITFYHPLQLGGETAAQIALALAKGESVEKYIDSYTQSGSYKIPTKMIQPLMVDKNNIDEILFKSGVYNASDF